MTGEVPGGVLGGSGGGWRGSGVWGSSLSLAAFGDVLGAFGEGLEKIWEVLEKVEEVLGVWEVPGGGLGFGVAGNFRFWLCLWDLLESPGWSRPCGVPVLGLQHFHGLGWIWDHPTPPLLPNPCSSPTSPSTSKELPWKETPKIQNSLGMLGWDVQFLPLGVSFSLFKKSGIIPFAFPYFFKIWDNPICTRSNPIPL